MTTSQIGPVTDVTWLCRGSLLPDPRYDAVRAVFLAVMDDVEECPDGLYTARLLLFDDTGTAAKDAMNYVQASQQSKTPEILYQCPCFFAHSVLTNMCQPQQPISYDSILGICIGSEINDIHC